MSPDENQEPKEIRLNDVGKPAENQDVELPLELPTVDASNPPPTVGPAPEPRGGVAEEAGAPARSPSLGSATRSEAKLAEGRQAMRVKILSNRASSDRPRSIGKENEGGWRSAENIDEEFVLGALSVPEPATAESIDALVRRLHEDAPIVGVISMEGADRIVGHALRQWSGLDVDKPLQVYQIREKGLVASGQINDIPEFLPKMAETAPKVLVAKLLSSESKNDLLFHLLKPQKYEELAASLRLHKTKLVLEIEHLDKRQPTDLYRCRSFPAWLFEAHWWKEMLARWKHMFHSLGDWIEENDRLIEEAIGSKINQRRLQVGMQEFEGKLAGGTPQELRPLFEQMLASAKGLDPALTKLIEMFRAPAEQRALEQTALAIAALSPIHLDYRSFRQLGAAVLSEEKVIVAEWHAVEQIEAAKGEKTEKRISKVLERSAADVWISRFDQTLVDVGLKISNGMTGRTIAFSAKSDEGEIYNLLSTRYPSIVFTIADAVYRNRYILSPLDGLRRAAITFLVEALEFAPETYRDHIAGVLENAEQLLINPDGEIHPGCRVREEFLRRGDHIVCLIDLFSMILDLGNDDFTAIVLSLLKRTDGSDEAIGFRILLCIRLGFESGQKIDASAVLTELIDTIDPAHYPTIRQTIVAWADRGWSEARQAMLAVGPMLKPAGTSAKASPSYFLAQEIFIVLLSAESIRFFRYDPGLARTPAENLLLQSDAACQKIIEFIANTDFKIVAIRCMTPTSDTLCDLLEFLIFKSDGEEFFFDPSSWRSIVFRQVLSEAAFFYTGRGDLRSGPGQVTTVDHLRNLWLGVQKLSKNWPLIETLIADEDGDELDGFFDDVESDIQVWQQHLEVAAWPLTLFGSFLLLDWCFQLTGIDGHKPFHKGEAKNLDHDRRIVGGLLDNILRALPKDQRKQLIGRWQAIEWLLLTVAQRLTAATVPSGDAKTARTIALMLTTKAEKVRMMRKGLKRREFENTTEAK